MRKYYSDDEREWALALKAKFVAWLKENDIHKNGILNRAQFANKIGITTRNIKSIIVADISSQTLVYAKVHQLTGFPESDPTTIPPSTKRKRALTQDEYETWQANNTDLLAEIVKLRQFLAMENNHTVDISKGKSVASSYAKAIKADYEGHHDVGIIEVDDGDGFLEETVGSTQPDPLDLNYVFHMQMVQAVKTALQESGMLSLLKQPTQAAPVGTTGMVEGLVPSVQAGVLIIDLVRFLKQSIISDPQAVQTLYDISTDALAELYALLSALTLNTQEDRLANLTVFEEYGNNGDE